MYRTMGRPEKRVPAVHTFPGYLNRLGILGARYDASPCPSLGTKQLAGGAT
jgi:hypothetical protein